MGKSSLLNMEFYMTKLLEYGEVVGAAKVSLLFPSQNLSRKLSWLAELGT